MIEREPNVGIVGTHVDASLSPVMHNAAYAEMGVDLYYGHFPLPDIHDETQRSSMFGNFLLEQIHYGVVGMSVTMPFKHDALRSSLVETPAGVAAAIGAVNTLSRSTEGQLWTPNNTDWLGAVRSLEEAEVEISGSQALVIGAGGTARAVAFGLAQRGTSTVILANRTLEKATTLADELSTHYPAKDFVATTLDQLASSDGEPQAFLADADIVYNTTNIGQDGTPGEGRSVLSAEQIRRLKPGAVMNDAVYMPLVTPVMNAVSELRDDVTIVDGTRMLLHQAVEQVREFTKDDNVPVKAMDAALQGEIQRRSLATAQQ